jgi:hypothetical protein
MNDWKYTIEKSKIKIFEFIEGGIMNRMNGGYIEMKEY